MNKTCWLTPDWTSFYLCLRSVSFVNSYIYEVKVINVCDYTHPDRNIWWRCCGATSMCMKMTILLIWCFGRISPSEWAEPDTDDHSFTFSHSLWYLMGSLTLQGKPEHVFSLVTPNPGTALLERTTMLNTFYRSILQNPPLLWLWSQVLVLTLKVPRVDWSAPFGGSLRLCC